MEKEGWAGDVWSGGWTAGGSGRVAVVRVDSGSQCGSNGGKISAAVAVLT
jgi:hypothetical protein